jgi:hypothetical protein
MTPIAIRLDCAAWPIAFSLQGVVARGVMEEHMCCVSQHANTSIIPLGIAASFNRLLISSLQHPITPPTHWWCCRLQLVADFLLAASHHPTNTLVVLPASTGC